VKNGSEMDAQTIIVIAIAALMAFFLVRYVVRIVRSKDGTGCGCGCGCSSTSKKKEAEE